MFHCNLMIAEGLMTSVGSTNFDMRSFRLNHKANLNIYGTAFAQHQTEVFEEDLQRAERTTLAAWQGRPLGDKLLGRLATLFRALL